jgi:hypothetical protein
VRLGGTSLRVLWLLLSVAGCAMGCGLTSTVDPGTFEGVRDLKLDENYYYCVVQPQVITAKRCAPGDAGDPSGGCHASKSSMILVDIPTPVACSGTRPTGTVSASERANYQAAQLRVTRDPESAPLLARPTGKMSHPRVIFASNSPEADIIRAWIKGAR